MTAVVLFVVASIILLLVWIAPTEEEIEFLNQYAELQRYQNAKNYLDWINREVACRGIDNVRTQFSSQGLDFDYIVSECQRIVWGL